jgi:hypothetical protein
MASRWESGKRSSFMAPPFLSLRTGGVMVDVTGQSLVWLLVGTHGVDETALDKYQVAVRHRFRVKDHPL